MQLSRPLVLAAAFAGAALLLFGCSDTAIPTGPEPPTGSDGGSSVTFSSEAPPGDSARSFLTDRRLTVLELEVDYMTGYKPTDDALDSLKTALYAHLSKSTINLGSSTTASRCSRITATTAMGITARRRSA